MKLFDAKVDYEEANYTNRIFGWRTVAAMIGLKPTQMRRHIQRRNIHAFKDRWGRWWITFEARQNFLSQWAKGYSFPTPVTDYYKKGE